MGEGLRMVVGDRAFDGSPLSWADDDGMHVPGVTVSSESDPQMAAELNLALEARLSARLVLGVLQARTRPGRAPHSADVRPSFGPDAPTRPVLTQHEDGSYGAGTVQVVPRIRIDWL